MSKKKKSRIHQELESLDLTINSFGELKSSSQIDKINKFLNKNINDKKLRKRGDLDKSRDNDSDKSE